MYNAHRKITEIIEPTICSFIKRTADGVRLGAFGIYYGKGAINELGQSMNETGVIREPRSLNDVYIAALQRLSAIKAPHKHYEVRIKTSILPIAKLIRNFRNSGLQQYKSRDGIDELKKVLQGFDNVTVMFRREYRNARGGKLYQARKLAVREFNLREDSTYWKNGIPKVYTDGSCENNGKKDAVAGGGVYWGPGDARNQTVMVPGEQTNNRGEYVAVVAALNKAIDEKIFQLIICADCEILIKSMKDWLPTWKEKGMKKSDKKPVENQDLIMQIEELMGKMEYVEFEKVLAHSGHEGNEGADQLAREAVEEAKRLRGLK